MSYGLSVKDDLGGEVISDYQPFNFVRRYAVTARAKNKSFYVGGINGALKVVLINTGGTIASIYVRGHNVSYSTMGSSGHGFIYCFSSRT